MPKPDATELREALKDWCNALELESNDAEYEAGVAMADAIERFIARNYQESLTDGTERPDPSETEPHYRERMIALGYATGRRDALDEPLRADAPDPYAFADAYRAMVQRAEATDTGPNLRRTLADAYADYAETGKIN